MSRQCAHCDRWFKNKQAVRAHLRRCENWIQAKEAGYRPVYQLVDALKCGICWQGPTDSGHAGTTYDVLKVRGICPLCRRDPRTVGEAWVVVGKKRLSPDRIREYQQELASLGIQLQP